MTSTRPASLGEHERRLAPGPRGGGGGGGGGGGRPRPPGQGLVRSADPAHGPDRLAGVVVLWDLPALYARGLREALLQAGCGQVSVYEGQQPPPVSAPQDDGTTVVVAATETVTGVEVLVALAGAAVVELVADAGVEAFIAAMQRGAVGVLEPGSELEHAVEVLAAVAAGLVVLPDHVVDQVLAAGREHTSAPALSETERSWLRWLGTGGTVATLAASACYSEREMYRLLRALYTRMGAGGRTEALLQAERWGLLDD